MNDFFANLYAFVPIFPAFSFALILVVALLCIIAHYCALALIFLGCILLFFVFLTDIVLQKPFFTRYLCLGGL